MERLLRDGISKYKKDGVKGLISGSLRRVANNIEGISNEEKKKKITRKYRQSPKYLNVGGGAFVKEDWRVLDYYSDWYNYDSIFIDYVVDLEERTNWEIESEDYDLVFTSHTLEHLTDEAVKHTLSESNRILKSGGGIRVVVPDVDIAIYHYENGNIDWFENLGQPGNGYEPVSSREVDDDYLLEYHLLRFFATYLTHPKFNDRYIQEFKSDWNDMQKEKVLQKYSRKIKDVWHKESPGNHRNWYNYERLYKLLKNSGFDSIEENRYQQSRFVELCDESFDKRPWMSVYVDAIKP